jgi:hypothetical protein
MIEGEEPSLHHFIKAKTRRDSRIVSAIQDSADVTHTTTMIILRTFSSFLRTKYDNTPADDESIRALTGNINNKLPTAANLAQDAPITMDELQRAIKKGKPNKAPGSDGISQEYFNTTLEITKNDMLEIVNQMYVDGKIAVKQKHRMIVCIPKKPKPTHPEDYRPLTLLNALLQTDVPDNCGPIKHPANYPPPSKSILWNTWSHCF